jgi:FixJ family two-component response regulator
MTLARADLPPKMSVIPATIGIVDDDPSILRAVKRLLRTAGFTVKTFDSAETLLSSDRLDQINCLVLDIHLGGLNGFDLQERVAGTHPEIPIIFITALDDALTRERARRTGAVDYLNKPFASKTLLAAINRALDRS